MSTLTHAWQLWWLANGHLLLHFSPTIHSSIFQLLFCFAFDVDLLGIYAHFFLPLSTNDDDDDDGGPLCWQFCGSRIVVFMISRTTTAGWWWWRVKHGDFGGLVMSLQLPSFPFHFLPIFFSHCTLLWF